MSLRNLPSVDRLLGTPAAQSLQAQYGRPLLVEALRAVLSAARAAGRAGAPLPSADQLIAQAGDLLLGWLRPTLEGVINATGVILHTNLGRAPLSREAIAAMAAVAGSYSNLEFDLATGKRGSRLVHAGALLTRLTGAPAAAVVNNCASATLLTLAALASRKRVIIARSQLIEIGGGFRVPDVMRQSGARLVEVGTTNKVRLSDYAEALEQPAVVMRAHRSNFKLVGFTEEPLLPEIVALAHERGAIFIDDLGSGALLDTARYGLEHEPMVQESLAAGADVILCSGDKLLGGPQAGIILGRADLLERIKKHPLARAVRADKTCLAGLAATLTHYLKAEAEHAVPVWRMIATPLQELEVRARRWQEALAAGEVIQAESTVGGGSLPGQNLPGWVLALDVRSPDRALARLRAQTPPVIAYTAGGRVLLDPRTVLPEQEDSLLGALRSLLAAGSSSGARDEN